MKKEAGKTCGEDAVNDMKSEARGEGGQQAQAQNQNQSQNQSMEFHRKVLEKRLGEQGYVFCLPYSYSLFSPSFFFCGSGGGDGENKQRRETRLMDYYITEARNNHTFPRRIRSCRPARRSCRRIRANIS